MSFRRWFALGSVWTVLVLARGAHADELPNWFASGGMKGQSPWLSHCLRRVKVGGLRRGSALTMDCGGDSPMGKRARCAAQCDGRCMFSGDFDGDGAGRDVAIAHAAGKGDSSLWIVKSVGSARGGRFEPTAYFPIRADDVAFISSSIADEAVQRGQAISGAKPNFQLAPGERFSFGVLTWRRVDGGWDGDLSAVVWSKTTGTYRLVPMLALESD